MAFNHAGRADKDDFVQQLGDWSDTQEQAWHDMCDTVLVGSEFHKRRVVEKFNHKDVRVTGAVWSKEWMDDLCNDLDRTKEDYIIFPHRPCKEKRFEEFLQVARVNPELDFVITSGGKNRLRDVELPSNVKYRFGLTKKEYYQLFAKAKGYLSLAAQETFGYTLQEAIYFGCRVVVPDNACYREYADKECVYDLKDLLKPSFLTGIFREKRLDCGMCIADNAQVIYDICNKD